MTSRLKAGLLRFLSDYGMLPVLLLLCVFYSVATLKTQDPSGAAAGDQLAELVLRRFPADARVLAIVQDTAEDDALAEVVVSRLRTGGRQDVSVVRGRPVDARRALEAARKPDVLVCTAATADWSVIDDRARLFPALADTPVLKPYRYTWPVFLNASNLLNIANQIAVIAILAVGMTLVVLTGGIDLSVGSLVALSAVVTALLIRDLAGAENASGAGVVLCCLVGVAACALAGLASGLLVVFFELPSFIVTLAMMSIASGWAFKLARNQSIYQVPASFGWLGLGADLFGLPNAVVLALALYLAAHVLMTRMTLGRYIYAVGGNAEAARLSGVPVRGVLLFVYTVCGGLAGLGGIVLASQLKSGAPTYGVMYELSTIAAVAVGGTSLRGGEGKIFGTLIGALIIAVIQNGMNLTDVGSEAQRIVLGAVILGAVLLDTVKRRLLEWLRRGGKGSMVTTDAKAEQREGP